jgi:hypothetical protein
MTNTHTEETMVAGNPVGDIRLPDDDSEDIFMSSGTSYSHCD